MFRLTRANSVNRQVSNPMFGPATTDTSAGARLIFKLLVSNLFVIVALLALPVGEVKAQTSATDGTTPLALSPGAPAGSYALSEFDNVNLYNGNLNFNLPLLKIGGRGGTPFTLNLPIERHWRVKHHVFQNGGNNYDVYEPTAKSWTTHYDYLMSYRGPGLLQVRKEGRPFSSCGGLYRPTLTRMTFIAPDGTEYELLDQLTGGKPVSAPFNHAGCDTQEVLRGTVFVTADGTSATFIADEDVYDEQHAGATVEAVSGFMLMRDGTRYRIVNGVTTWVRDRNGNKTAFAYDAHKRLTSVTDSLGRVVTITYATLIPIELVSPTPTGYDEISFKGYGGAPRTIRLWHTALQNALSQGEAVQSHGALFPELPQPVGNPHYSPSAPFNPPVLSAVELPDERRYEFSYNRYGELTRVELPTGGATEYDYDGGGPGPDSGVLHRSVNADRAYQIYRRVVARRIFSDGITLDERTSFTASEETDAATNANISLITTQSFDRQNKLLTHAEHFYFGHASASLYKASLTYPAYNEGREFRTKLYDTDGVNATALLRSVEHTWQPGTPISSNPTRAVNGRISDTVTTLADMNQVAKQHFDYDVYNNRTDVYEYDFGAGGVGALIRHSHTDFLTTNTAGGTTHDYACDPATTCSAAQITPDAIHLRSLPSRQSVYDAAGVERARAAFEYDNYAPDANHAALVDRADIAGLCTTFNPAGQCGSSNSAGYQTRGNVTAVTSFLLSGNGTVTGSITPYMQYDVAGNVVKAIDGRGFASTISFNDSYGSPDDEARSNSAPQELMSLTSYAFPTKVTDALGHATYMQYDYHLGTPVNTEDANGVVSSVSYDDDLDRPKRSQRAVGTDQAGQTTINYDDANRTVTVTSDLNAYNDNLLKTETIYDGMGRTTESRAYESASSYITTQREYDALGRVSGVSNPYRSTNDPTYGLTTTTYDALGRVKIVTAPDGAQVRTDYEGTKVLVRDQAGKRRLSDTDSLGQLTDVWEIAPSDSATVAVTFSGQTLTGYLTRYQYDILGNLRQVTQDTQMRVFAYDSLSRLTSATNPESGTVQYRYDANNNLVLKIDPRPRPGSGTLPDCPIPYADNQVATCSEYDPLNRVKSRTYNDGTPNVTFTYDASGAYSKGRLSSVSSSVSTYGYIAYDALGRVKSSSQTVDGVTYGMPDYNYNLAGGLTSQTYPSGKVVTTEYDPAGRIAGVKNQATGHYYAGAGPAATTNRLRYAPHGAVSALKLGNELWEATSYNSRLQIDSIKLGTADGDADRWQLSYGYGPAGENNGNVRGQTLTVPEVGGAGFAATQVYTYDPLNRVASAAETQAGGGGGWKQKFLYDRFGNRRVDANPAETTPALAGPNLAFEPATNRISSTGYGYDAAGNLTQSPAMSDLLSYEYDGENRQVRFRRGAAVQAEYAYDGQGRRVRKVDYTSGGAVTTLFIYDAAGRLVVEYGGPMPASSGGVSYLTQDHLGSTRVVTGVNGGVKSRHDYVPFGQELKAGLVESARTDGQGYETQGQAGKVRQKFTGHERDDETGLDYMKARYYSSAQGRFTSPDAPLLDQSESDPQSWNLYAYTRNNPLYFTDPTGRRSTHTDEQGYVVAVYDDGDLGVYKHTNKIISDWDGNSNLPTKGKGTTKMGETEYWDEFRAHDNDTGEIQPEVAQGARILFDTSFDKDISRINSGASQQEVTDVGRMSRSGQPYDIKTNRTIAPEGPNTGRLLNGKYATARSAGNYLAGLNGATAFFGERGNYISEDRMMKLAGALQQKKLGTVNAARIIMFGTAFGPAPWYGEIEYSGRRIQTGFRDGVARRPPN